jgi:hypothetical protein
VGSPRRPTEAARRASCAGDAAPRPLPARAEDCRCRCGGLVARIVPAGVEIKCRRCKRDLLVPWSARDGWVRPIERDDRVVALDGGSS